MRFLINPSRGLLLALTTSVIAVTAAQAEIALPDPSEFVHVGQAAGMNVFKVDGTQGVWMITEDGKTIINGDYYDLTGAEPQMNFAPFTPAVAPVVAGDVMVPAEGVATSIAPEVITTTEIPAAEAPPPNSMINPLLDQASSALAGVSQEDQGKLVDDLVKRLDEAKSPEEFQLVIAQWRADIAGRSDLADIARDAITGLSPEAPTPAPTLPVVPQAPAAAPTADANIGLSPETLAGLAISPPLAALDLPEAEPGDDSTMLFNKMRTEGTWFSVGKPGAPTVYAIIDPMCPYCAQAINNLAPEIKAGNLDLRVLLAPIISSQAPDKIAGILSSENPAEAFLTHETEYAATGASRIKDMPFAGLDAKMNDGIKANRDIVIDNGLPGVPFFAYIDDKGIRFTSGVPQAGYFAGAHVDPMTSK